MWNGNLYCPATPKALFDLGPLGRRASEAEVGAHDERIAELAALQARAHRRSRCRGLLPGVTCISRGDGQGPLPATRSVDGARPLSSRGGIGARTPSFVLHAADDHRPALGRPKDRPTSRLPLAALAPFLCPALRRRPRQCQDQGPGHDRRGPGVVPGDGTRPSAWCSPAPSWCATSPSPMRSKSTSKGQDERRARSGLPRRQHVSGGARVLGDLAGASASAPP